MINKPKINKTPSKLSVEIKEDVQSTVTEEVKVELKKEITPFVNEDKVPFFWEISSNGDGTVTCINTQTKTTFKGKMSEFNAKLRG
jgi:hypothetical protein